MEKPRKKQQIILTEGPIFKGLLKFSIPILLGCIVTQLYNVADSAIVGRFVSSEALASVSAATPIMSFINLFLIGLSTGANVVIAQRVGAGDKAALQRSIDTIGFLTLVCGLLVTAIGLTVSKPLLRSLGTPEGILRDAYIYLIVIYIGTTGNLVYQMGSSALRGMGDSSWPFYFLLLCSGLNVVLDLAAVLILKLGVPGVAIATALSQFVSGVGVVVRMNSGNYDVSLKLKNLRPDPGESKSIMTISLPAAIQNVGNSLAAILVQTSVNVFGTEFIAANSIVTKVDDMLNIPVVALSTALCTFVGQNMGKFDLDRIRKGINYSIWSLTGLGVIMMGVLIALRNVLPLMFTEDKTVLMYASEGLLIMSFQCVFIGIDRCLVNAMRGAGKSVVPMVTAQFSVFSRIPLAYLLGAKPMNWRGIFYALLIAAFLRSAAIAVYYYCGGWKRALQKFRRQRGLGN